MTDGAPMLEVDGLGKTYGSGDQAVRAIEEISFTVARSEFLCVVGPSGCGKTTLLRCLSGLMPATSGQVRVEGRPLDRTPEDMAIVFQDYSRSLFPWMTVEENIAFPLRRKRLDRKKKQTLIADSLSAVGLADAASATRGSSPAACSSAWPSPGPSPTSRRSCSWTSRSRPSTRRPAPTWRT
jgi:NitT/TauT family transport system ATP-binding protein